jgi:hypothetical protein
VDAVLGEPGERGLLVALGVLGGVVQLVGLGGVE